MLGINSRPRKKPIKRTGQIIFTFLTNKSFLATAAQRFVYKRSKRAIWPRSQSSALTPAVTNSPPSDPDAKRHTGYRSHPPNGTQREAPQVAVLHKALVLARRLQANAQAPSTRRANSVPESRCHSRQPSDPVSKSLLDYNAQGPIARRQPGWPKPETTPARQLLPKFYACLSTSQPSFEKFVKYDGATRMKATIATDISRTASASAQQQKPQKSQHF
jgi:hypothetical protein